ncbi:MAG: serine/threonine protein kinase, partial [Mariniblastus sp.]
MTPNPSDKTPAKPDQPEMDESEILEQVVDEFTKRIRSGEHPAIAEYQEQHPNLKEEIEDLLASVAMIEQLKSNPSKTAASNRPSLDEVSNLSHIGSYEVIREIGRGGMGVVFEAVHESLGRRVAIKVMPTPLVNSEKYVERFKRESQAAAKLHHTNIVSVFGVGQGEGYHFYVMDLVDGQSLSDVVFGLANSPSNDSTKRIAKKHFPTIIQGTEGTGQDDSGFEIQISAKESSSV